MYSCSRQFWIWKINTIRIHKSVAQFLFATDNRMFFPNLNRHPSSNNPKRLARASYDMITSDKPIDQGSRQNHQITWGAGKQ